jgi:hypothetical protein
MSSLVSDVSSYNKRDLLNQPMPADPSDSGWTITPFEVDKALSLLDDVVNYAQIKSEDMRWLLTELPRKVHNSCLIDEDLVNENSCHAAFDVLRERHAGRKLDAIQLMLLGHLRRALVKLSPPVDFSTVSNKSKYAVLAECSALMAEARRESASPWLFQPKTMPEAQDNPRWTVSAEEISMRALMPRPTTEAP